MWHPRAVLLDGGWEGRQEGWHKDGMTLLKRICTRTIVGPKNSNGTHHAPDGGVLEGEARQVHADEARVAQLIARGVQAVVLGREDRAGV